MFTAITDDIIGHDFHAWEISMEYRRKVEAPIVTHYQDHFQHCWNSKSLPSMYKICKLLRKNNNRFFASNSVGIPLYLYSASAASIPMIQ